MIKNALVFANFSTVFGLTSGMGGCPSVRAKRAGLPPCRGLFDKLFYIGSFKVAKK